MGIIAGVPSTGGQTTIGLSANIPLFQGGLPAARIRQAQAQQGQVFEQVVGTERAVVQTARAAFANYDAAQERFRPRRWRFRRTSSRSKATAPSRASAPAPSSKC